MAMTPLERKRLSLARKAEREKLAGDPTDAIATIKFNEFLADNPNWDEVATYLEWAGIDPNGIPTFDADDDPGHPETDGPYRGSIGRAERMVGCLLDAATELATIINTYKKQAIEKEEDRLNEIAGTANADERREILAELVKLNRLADRLNKQVRRSLPDWNLKGD